MVSHRLTEQTEPIDHIVWLPEVLSLRSGISNTNTTVQIAPACAELDGWASIFQPLGSIGCVRKFQLYTGLPLKEIRGTWRQQPGNTDHGEIPWSELTDSIKRVHRLGGRWNDLMAIMKLVHGFAATRQAYMQSEELKNAGVVKPQSRSRDYTSSNREVSVENESRRARHKCRVPVRAGKESQNEEHLGENLKELFDFERILTDLVFEDVTYHRTIPIVSSPDSYLQQEEMLACTHTFFLDIFEGGKWTADPFRLFPPKGTMSHEGDWKWLSDACFGIGVLAKKNMNFEASQKARCVFAKLNTVIGSDGPHLMVKFWRICRYLYGLQSSLKDFGLLYEFLNHCGDLSKARNGVTSPITRLFRLFAGMDPSTILWGLRIGQLRAIQSLQLRIGKGHPTVLSMWVYYAKQWGMEDHYKNLLISHFKEAIGKAEDVFGESSSLTISILHDFTYYARYCIQDNKSLTEDLALKLRTRTEARLSAIHRPHWGSQVQYYVFATQVLAKSVHDRKDRNLAESLLERTAVILENGDVECQTRAMMLLEQLKRSLLKRGAYATAQSIQQKKDALQDSISQSVERQSSALIIDRTPEV